MLTDDEILHAIGNAEHGHTSRGTLLAIGRAVESAVLAKRAVVVPELTCRTCVHLDTDPKDYPCRGCESFGRWERRRA